MTDDDDKLDYLKSRLYRGFGVEVRQDLQVRAEIIIQPEPGRWMFTPDELNDLTEGLNSILLSSNREAGMALPTDAQAIHRAVRSLSL